MEHHTAGLGKDTCACCLGTMPVGGMIAVRRRHVVLPGLNAVEIIESVAHAECALESNLSNWIIEIGSNA